MTELPRGLYAVLVTERLRDELEQLGPQQRPEITGLRAARRRTGSPCT